MGTFREILKSRADNEIETTYLILQDGQQVMAYNLVVDLEKDTVTFLNAKGINARNAGTLSSPNPSFNYYTTRPISDFKDVG